MKGKLWVNVERLLRGGIKSMETSKAEKVTLSPQILKKTIFRVVILYLLVLITIFSYIPFDIQYAAFDEEGHFALSSFTIEYAWLNPPPEDARKMIAGVDWPRIYLEITALSIVAAGFCILSKK
jgi:hypothetical protein